LRAAAVKVPMAEVQAAAGLGDLPGHVELFLLQVLKQKSLEAYVAGLRDFRTEIDAQDFPWRSASEERRDLFLAELLVELRERGWKRQRCAVILSALHKILPRQRFRTASAILAAWKHLEPPRQAPACPFGLAWAMAVLAVALGRTDIGIVIALCFAGALRFSEPLRLTSGDILLTTNAVVVLLAETKRGLEQRVVIRELCLLNWMRKFLAAKDLVWGECVFALSYAKMAYWIRKLSAALGFEALRLTSHSMRRGGASHLLASGWPVADVCVCGRWKPMASAQEYLRQGVRST